MATVYEARRFGRNQVMPCTAVELGGAVTLIASTALTFDSPRFLQLNATAGGFVVTLPATPYEGCTYYLGEIAGSANTVTIAGNGATIDGASLFLMNSAYRQRQLRAVSATAWILIDGVN